MKKIDYQAIYYKLQLKEKVQKMFEEYLLDKCTILNNISGAAFDVDLQKSKHDFEEKMLLEGIPCSVRIPQSLKPLMGENGLVPACFVIGALRAFGNELRGEASASSL